MQHKSENRFLRKYHDFSIGVLIIMMSVSTITISPQYQKENFTITEALPTWQVNNPVSKVFVMDQIPPTAGSLAAGDSTVPKCISG